MSKSSSLRRIQADIRELAKGPSDRYHAAPLEDDMFEWHFTIRGADQTEFEGGVYHGRILLPPEYPFKPPHIIFLTPSGRFEVNTKVCLSFSAYHPELWQPAWGIRLILEALISFLPAPADGAIGALDWTKEERMKLAKKSLDFRCQKCGNCANLLPKICSTAKANGGGKFSKEIEKLHELQLASEGANKKEASPPSSTTNDAESNSDPEPVEADYQNEKLDKKRISEENPTSDESSQENEVAVCQTATTPLSNNTPNPVVNEASGGVTTNRAFEAVDDQELQNRNDDDLRPSWLNDPLLHGSIVTFAAIVFLLYRKVDSLLNELRLLDENEY